MKKLLLILLVVLGGCDDSINRTENYFVLTDVNVYKGQEYVAYDVRAGYPIGDDSSYSIYRYEHDEYDKAKDLCAKLNNGDPGYRRLEAESLAAVNKPPVMKPMAQDNEIPPLVVVAHWLAYYGMEVIVPTAAPTWRSAYPDSGTGLHHLIWRVETIVPAIGVSPSNAEGVFSELRILTQPGHQDSLRVSVAGVDSAGVQSDFSPVGRW